MSRDGMGLCCAMVAGTTRLWARCGVGVGGVPLSGGLQPTGMGLLILGAVGRGQAGPCRTGAGPHPALPPVFFAGECGELRSCQTCTAGTASPNGSACVWVGCGAPQEPGEGGSALVGRAPGIPQPQVPAASPYPAPPDQHQAAALLLSCQIQLSTLGCVAPAAFPSPGPPHLAQHGSILQL